MLVHKENYEETKRKFTASIKSAKERMTTLHQQVKQGYDCEPLGNQNDDDPATAIQEVYSFLRDINLAAEKYEAATTDSNMTGFLKENRKVFLSNLEWSNARLKKVQRALEIHEGRRLRADGRADADR